MIKKSLKTTRDPILSRFLSRKKLSNNILSSTRVNFDVNRSKSKIIKSHGNFSKNKSLINQISNRKGKIGKVSKIKSKLFSLKKSVASLPELNKQSSVKKRSLRSIIKYILFVIEPHWQYFYSGSKSIGVWVKSAALILWQSKRGKIIMVQVGVIGVLAALLVWQLQPAIPLPKSTYAQDNSSITPASENLGVRRYLPTAREYIPPSAFEPVTVLAEKIPLSAWIAPWNIGEQKDSLKKYTSISAFWLTLNENGYDVDAKGNWEPWTEATKDLTIDSTTKWLSISGDPDYVFKALTNSDLENKLIENLAYNVDKWGFDGIDIDFEGLGTNNKDVFSIFIKHLSEKFHNIGKFVSVTVEVRIDDPPMDWPTLSQYVDEIRPMFYDYHSRNTGYPGPISPIGWIDEKMKVIKKDIPMEKVVPALGNYGYDWQKSTDPLTINEYHGVGLSFEKAVNLAAEKDQQIDRAKGNDPRGYDIGDAPHFSYFDGYNNEHHVWFEDKLSLTAKANLISKYQPKSIIFWNVGSLGDTLYWQIEDFNSKNNNLIYPETESLDNSVNSDSASNPPNAQ